MRWNVLKRATKLFYRRTVSILENILTVVNSHFNKMNGPCLYCPGYVEVTLMDHVRYVAKTVTRLLFVILDSLDS